MCVLMSDHFLLLDSMEGSSNEQGGDSLTNDWRTQHEPGLRERVIYEIVKKLKKCCHQPSNENDIKKAAIKYEAKIYGMAKDKDAYLGKICRKVFSSHSPFRAQEQSLPTSLPYTQTPTSQSNLNVPESSGLPTQVPLTVSAAQNLKIQMSEEGVHSNKLPGHPQREIQQLESENLISQLMNGQDTQKNHPQNKGEEQEQTTPRVSTSQQNNMASCNVHGPSLLGTQSQEVEQSQPLMLQYLNDVHDWREETYHKIKVLKEKYGLVLSTFFKSISDKLREIDSLRQQNMPVEWLTASKATLEQVLAFLNVCKSSVSEFHRDKFSLHEEKVLRFIEYHHLNVTRRAMKQQQVYLPPSHTHQTRPRMEPEDENSPMSTAAQEHLPPEPITERPIDRLIKAVSEEVILR
ncbi:probable mediator of RNA polymerase II transcription subunit 15c [Brassica rapa]|uniref:probable mediator of RNA polymerase II transcription subunit 15c n=1 Tax=Brassica campestris TaxID=3711 RepID=UPI00142E4489|nr:probable mediator of RNA polymerase II transcription subunit 15c [Brassica rapa]